MLIIHNFTTLTSCEKDYKKIRLNITQFLMVFNLNDRKDIAYT